MSFISSLVISVLGAAVGVGTLVWTIIHNRRTTFINTVTSERIKWIGKLRENLSRFVGKSHTFMVTKSDADNEAHDKLRAEIDVLRYEIKLQLNPGDEPDKSIVLKVNEIPNLVCQTDLTPALAAIDHLIELSQHLLRAEWIKVKEEARRGALADELTWLERLKQNIGQVAAFGPVYVICAGLFLTLAGSVVAANEGIMTEQVATDLATTKWSLNLDLRRSLIRQSRATRAGLALIGLGSAVQVAGMGWQVIGNCRRSTKRVPLT